MDGFLIGTVMCYSYVLYLFNIYVSVLGFGTVYLLSYL